MDLRSGKQLGEESTETQSDQESVEEQGTSVGEASETGVKSMLEQMMKTIMEDRKRLEETIKDGRMEDRKQLEETIKEGRKEDLEKLEQGRKQDAQKIGEELKQMEQNRKQDMENMAKIIEKKVEDLKEEIRTDIQSWKKDVEKNVEKVEQEMTTVVKKTIEIEDIVRKQEHEIGNIEKNITKNTQEIELVKSQVQKGIPADQEVLDNERKRTEEQIEQLKKEIEHVREMKHREGEVITKIICHEDNKIHKFSGNINKLHPVVFLKALTRKIQEIYDRTTSEDTRMDRIKETIRENLENEALLWFNGIENNINDYTQFTQRFTQHFWGDNAQLAVREKLYFGKYNPNLTNSLTNYALRLYSSAQYLTPKLNEQDLVLYISRQFKPEIAETIAMQNIRTMEQMYSYLNRVERNVTNNHQNYSNNMNNSTRNNSQNFRNNQNNNNQDFRYNNNFNHRSNNFRPNNNNNTNYPRNNFNNNFNTNNRYNNNGNNFNYNNRYNNNRNQQYQYNNNRNYNNNNNDNFNNRFNNNNQNYNRNQNQPLRRDDGNQNRQVNFQSIRNSSRSVERVQNPQGDERPVEQRRSVSMDREPEIQNVDNNQNFQ